MLFRSGGAASGFVSAGGVGALVGAVAGFGGEYVSQKYGLQGPGSLSGVGSAVGLLGASGGVASRLAGAVAGGLTGGLAAGANGSFTNTVSAGIGGLAGTFGAQLLVRGRPYSPNGSPLFAAIKGGWAGLVGGFTQDIFEMGLRHFLECKNNEPCEKK